MYFWKPNICTCQLDVQEAELLSRTESESISLDAGLRMDGFSALDLWDIVLRSTNDSVQPKRTNIQETGATLLSKTKAQNVKRRLKVDQLSDVYDVPTNMHSSQNESQLYIFEAMINTIIKGRSPTMRHVSRTHRVALDWLLDRINLDPKIKIIFVDTKTQLADMANQSKFHAS